MTKIVHLTSVHPPQDVRIQKECQTLAQAGFKVTLILPTAHENRVGEVKICAVSEPKNRLDRMVKSTWEVYRKAQKLEADVYHIHDPELLPWAQLLRAGKSHVIYDMHENVPGAVMFKPWLPSFCRWLIAGIYRCIERPLLAGLHIIFAENSYRELYPWVKNVETVLNMPRVDHLLQIHEPKYANPTLGYIGRVGPLRGSSVIVEALHLLKQDGKVVHWECLGPLSIEHQNELKSKIAAYGLKNVNMYGYVLPENGWPIIARCHIGMAILKATPNSTESYPTKMFEYMALGLPVVASDFHLYRQIIEGSNCGLCVDPEDPSTIAAAISWLLAHPSEAQAMGERGRQAVLKQYNWNSQAQKLLAFYDRLLKHN